MKCKKAKRYFLAFSIPLLLALLFASIFKNLSYPLLWNDEAETAMFGQRILEFGYPKVHDGKNVMYILEDKNHNLGVRQSDTYVGMVWGQYYLASLGAYLAKSSNDLYMKTALIRLPFAITGLMGIIIFALAFAQVFEERIKRKYFTAAFLFLELISVSLALHLREVRYYSLAFLLSAIIFYLFIRFHFLAKPGYRTYFVGMFGAFVLLFHTYHPFYFALLSGLVGYLIYIAAANRYNKNIARPLLIESMPIVASLIFIVPSMIFFKTPAATKEFSKLYNFNLGVYFNNIGLMLSFFERYEIFALAVILKLILVIVIFSAKQEKNFKQPTATVISNFLTLFFLVYLLIEARMPFIFERYVLILQPVLMAMIIYDLFSVRELLIKLSKQAMIKAREIDIVLGAIVMAVLVLTGSAKFDSIKNHFYEISHQYKGPLDYAIPYIKERFEKPEDAVIATNYEENAYMYYLGSKTIVGYVGNNLASDQKAQPDIIIFRKQYYDHFPEVFNKYLLSADYEKVGFPVFDYPVNNISELNLKLKHLYRTKYAGSDDQKLDLFIKR